MNPNAPAFVWNPNATVFVPGGRPAVPAPVPAPAAAPVPAPAPAVAAAEPAAAPAPVSASWEDEPHAAPAAAAPVAAAAAAPVAATPSAAPVAAPAPVTKIACGTSEDADTEMDDEELTPELAQELHKVSLEDSVELEESDSREHLNIIFIGHVDAGKSTLSGQLLFMHGMVDARTMDKYQREAVAQNRASWFLAYIMDTNEEERARGKTVELGRAHFATEKKRYTILDAPGHKSYVPNMIGGAAQADVALLVISARKGEFEAGFERTGQTREHAMLVKTLGVRKLFVLINKMDDPTVVLADNVWDRVRYEEITSKLTPYFKTLGYVLNTDFFYMPCSGYTGANIKEAVGAIECPWFKEVVPSGKPLMSILDDLEPFDRDPNAPLRMPVVSKFRDRGLTWIIGKIETGTLFKGQKYLLMPSKTPVEVIAIETEGQTHERKRALPGENVRAALKGIEEESVHEGYVLCDMKNPCKAPTRILGQLFILELLPGKAIFTAGYTCVLHVHTACEEVTITELRAQIDKKTQQLMPTKPKFVKSGALVRAVLEMPQGVCMERFEEYPSLGRFTLRDEGKTIAVGKVLRVGGAGATDAQPGSAGAN